MPYPSFPEEFSSPGHCLDIYTKNLEIYITNDKLETGSQFSTIKTSFLLKTVLYGGILYIY